MNETKSTRARTAIRKAASEPPALFVFFQISTVQKVEAMQTIPAGFIPNEWNQTFGAFKRLVEHLDAMQATLTECGELTPENCDITYIREQVTNEVDTLQFMASDAEKHWKALGVVVATAAGRLSLNRPADDVAWCAAVLNSSWQLHNGLRRELSGDNADVLVKRLPLHLGRIPIDIGQWCGKITAEIRAGALCVAQTPVFEFSKRTFRNQEIKDALNQREGRSAGVDSISDPTVERFIRSEKLAKRIDRKKKEPMRLRLDLMTELNLTDIDPS